MSCDECAQLFEQGFKKEFPCGDCPQQTPLSSDALHAWKIFKRSASRSTINVGAPGGAPSPKDFFEVDWNLVALLIDGDKEILEILIDLLKDLNS